MKKIFKFTILILTITGGITLPLVLSSCQKKTETDSMWDLITKIKSGKHEPMTNDQYFQKWVGLSNDDRQWAIEYSLFNNWLLKNGAEIIDGISLENEKNLYDYASSQDIAIRFSTTNNDINFNQENATFNFSYSGYLQIQIKTKLPLFADGVTTAMLIKNDLIQIAYSFTNASFQVSTGTEQSVFITNNFNKTGFGNAIGFSQISHNDTTYGNLSAIEDFNNDETIPNYFNAIRALQIKDNI